MLVLSILVSCLINATGVSIVEPVDGETYNGNWLTVKVIVENENLIPDSVHYSLSGSDAIQIPRLNTDWPTYMRTQSRNGYSESPGPTSDLILWTAPVTGMIHIFHSPVIVDGIVYFCHDSLYALSAATGESLWSYPLNEIGDDAPVVSDNKLYCISDSLFCFDLLTHDIVWSRAGGDFYNSNPVIYDDMLFIVYNQSGTPCAASCFDTEDGSRIWVKTLTGSAGSCMSLWNDLVIVPTHAALYALNTSDGSIVWKNSHSVSGYHDSTPCVVGDVIYIGSCDGDLLAINAASGVLIWELPILPSSSLEATPAFYDDIIICGNKETLFAANAITAEVIWQIDKGLHGSPAIADGIVYWGAWKKDMIEPDSLFAADIYTGEIIWSYLPDSTATLVTTPAIVDGVMYFPAANGYLYAFGTGLKYTYLDDLYAQIGFNELIVSSFDGGTVTADTVSFTVTGTGFNLEPSRLFNFTASPNPFVSTASISFELPDAGLTSIQIFDLYGRLVITLVCSEMLQGNHSVQWNGCNSSGEVVSAGLYLCRIESAGVVETTGLCLLE